ncbi:MAG: sterol desaturase family protein [Proteobacteria bacterium]|nr:sterol desaturase family protein [Pseudomonadota bacterium]
MAETRKSLQSEISANYRWWQHVATDLLLAGAVVAFALSRIEGLTAADLTTIPLAFLVANLGEYLLHRFPMHRPMPPREIYRRHTLCHHVFFTQDRMGMDSLRDLRWILFPAYSVPGLVLIMIPVAATVGALATANAGWLCLVVTACYYLMYEFLHTAYHLSPEGFIGRQRAIAYLRTLHQDHHDPRLMGSWNFNITFPIWDIIIGTWYRRGAGAAATPR